VLCASGDERIWSLTRAEGTERQENQPSQVLHGAYRTHTTAVCRKQSGLCKGLKKVLGDKADLVIRYRVAVDRQKQWNATGTGDLFRAPGLDTVMGSATATSTTIEVGTLVLDLYDAAAKQLVWTGHATKTINPSKDPQKNQKNIDKAMRKLLKDRGANLISIPQSITRLSSTSISAA